MCIVLVNKSVNKQKNSFFQLGNKFTTFLYFVQTFFAFF